MKFAKVVIGLMMVATLPACSNVTTVTYHEPTPNDIAAAQTLAHRFMLGEMCAYGFNMQMPNYSTQPPMKSYVRRRNPGFSTKEQLIYTWGQSENVAQCGRVSMVIKDPGPNGLQAYDFWNGNMELLQHVMYQEVRANTSPQGDVNMAALYGARDAAAGQMARNATALTVRPLFEYSDPTIKMGRNY